jgi:hypothetical protein
VPWLLFVGSAFWVYMSLKRCAVITIKTDQKKYKVALKEFEDMGTLKHLANFLSERVNLKNRYNIKK